MNKRGPRSEPCGTPQEKEKKRGLVEKPAERLRIYLLKSKPNVFQMVLTKAELKGGVWAGQSHLKVH